MAGFLNTHLATIKSIVDERAAKLGAVGDEEGAERSSRPTIFEEAVLSPEDFRRGLGAELVKADKTEKAMLYGISWSDSIDR